MSGLSDGRVAIMVADGCVWLESSSLTGYFRHLEGICRASSQSHEDAEDWRAAAFYWASAETLRRTADDLVLTSLEAEAWIRSRRA